MSVECTAAGWRGGLPLHLVEEISHRVINEYTEAIASLSLAARSADAQARLALDVAASRLRAHAEAHRALLAPSGDQRVDLAEHLAMVCRCMSAATLADHHIRLVLETDEVWLDADRCWRAGLIVAELIRNAVRHGLADCTGRIRVTVNRTSGCVSCLVCDNGSGRPHLQQPGRGRRLVQALAAELDGSVSWRFTPSGCHVEFHFPEARRGQRADRHS